MGTVVFEFTLWGLTCSLTWAQLAIVPICVYVYARFGQMIRGGIRPPLVSWALWGIMDGLAFGVQLDAGIFSILLACFTVGVAYVCYELIRARSFGWEWFDVVVALCTAAAAAVWLQSGDPHLGLIAMLSALTIAAMPYWWKVVMGKEDDIVVWSCLLVTSVLTYAGGEQLIGVVFGLTQAAFILPLAGWMLARRHGLAQA